MISFLEMVQRYPIGTKVTLAEAGAQRGKPQEITGYEYYNGTGYLVFGNSEKVDVERVIGMDRTKLH